jgi:hypothetical protein
MRAYDRYPHEKCPLPVYVVGEAKQKYFPVSKK